MIRLRHVLLTLLGLLTLTGAARAAEHTLKLGTIFPKTSPWGQVLETWVKAVAEKSGGRLELQIFYNGQQGDEAAMIGKIKMGQLAGAVVTGVGLGKVHKPILALQMPGLFTSWAKLDAARAALRPELEKGASDAGFTIAGWIDVGVSRWLTKGVALREPDHLKGKKPFTWRDSDMDAVLYQVLGGVTPVPLNIPEVLPNLNTGAINVINAPCLLAEKLQWSGKLDQVNTQPAAHLIGGLVASTKSLDALPEDLRTIFVDTAKVAGSALTKRIRTEDDAAFGRLKTRMTVLTPSGTELTKWDDFYKQVRIRLGQGTFSLDLVTRLEAMR